MIRVKHPKNLFKKLRILSIACLLASSNIIAKEGMWLPPTIKNHENQLKKLGLDIPIEKLYNESGTGLNNAIVLFGKGCTGEVISSKGLILTNHHCGYGTVQGLSSTEKDYFAKGFFARNLQEEIPCPGLTVTFVRKIENVTDKIIYGLADTLNDKTRDSIVNKRIAAVEKEYQKATQLDATIKPYYNGNQYWIAITETFKDIRLVGFPPDNIGAFGGDDENWVWPRHTGDFSVFRVYAGTDNKPAEYNSGNKPYQPSQFFNININGYREGDLTMVYGFPGTTQEYISSYELNHVYGINDPIAVKARTKRLDIWTEHMTADREVFIKYTSKRASVANGWKKWQGEMVGLKMNKAMSKKERYQKQFQKWANNDSSLPYASTILKDIKANTAPIDHILYLDQHIREEASAIELISAAAVGDKMLAVLKSVITGKALNDSLKKIAETTTGFYKNYDAATDKDVFEGLMPMYMKACKKNVPETFKEMKKANRKRYSRWADMVYNNSLFTSKDKLMAFAASATPTDTTVLQNDPAWKMNYGLATYRKLQIAPQLDAYKTRKQYLSRLYMKAQMQLDKEKMFYPDANLTLRITYGEVKGLDPDGKAKYAYQTTLKDVIDHNDTTKNWYKVPQKLKDLYLKRDFGRWAQHGMVPVAFVAANHTSGGNSGSPVLNKSGELIGTNFDRAYEGTMSDYLFDPERCRNISVDIRYTLFIIEKFGDAGWLIDEMNIKQ